MGLSANVVEVVVGDGCSIEYCVYSECESLKKQKTKTDLDRKNKSAVKVLFLSVIFAVCVKIVMSNQQFKNIFFSKKNASGV